MRFITKQLCSLSFTTALIAIMAATFAGTVSAASERSTIHTLRTSYQWSRVTAQNLQQFFPKSHSTIVRNAGSNSATCSFDSIQSFQNSNFVSTEIGYPSTDYAELRARASAVGPWEQYTICIDNTTSIMTIQANANGLYVSTEIGYQNSSYAMLRARATSVGPWEKYYLTCTIGWAGKVCTIQSQANGLFVTEEQNYGPNRNDNGFAMLRARTYPSNVNDWEYFYVNAA